MSATLEQRRAERKRPEQEGQESGLLEAVIRDAVTSALGSPPGPHRVQAKHLWEGHYRVNVFVGGDVASFKVAHSYFVEADGDGRILSSIPAVTRLY